MTKTKKNIKKVTGGNPTVEFSMKSFIKTAKIKAQLIKLIEEKIYSEKEVSCGTLHHYLYIIDLICETSNNEILQKMKQDLEIKIQKTDCSVKNVIPREILPKIRTNELVNMEISNDQANNDEIQNGGGEELEGNTFWKNASRKGEELISNISERINQFFKTENIDETIPKTEDKIGGETQINSVESDSFGLVLRGGKGKKTRYRIRKNRSRRTRRIRKKI